MIGTPPTGTLTAATISAVAHRGLSVTTSDGTPARLAILDADGHIIAEGQDVQREAWNVAISSYKQMLIGKGHLRIESKPLGEREE